MGIQAPEDGIGGRPYHPNSHQQRGSRVSGHIALHDLGAGIRCMRSGKIPVQQQVQQQFGVTPVVFLTAQRAFSDDIGIPNQQAMPEGFQQSVKPPCIPSGLQAHDSGNRKLRVENTHVVTLMIERALVDQSTRQNQKPSSTRA
ncbi:MAG: hypothetical protein WCD49_02680 [Candidatus Acidiferrales bacterium]